VERDSPHTTLARSEKQATPDLRRRKGCGISMEVVSIKARLPDNERLLECDQSGEEVVEVSGSAVGSSKRVFVTAVAPDPVDCFT